MITKAESLRLDTAIGNVKAFRPQIETVINVHMHRIAILLGQAPLSLVAELSDFQPMPEMKGLLPVGLPSDLLNRRPDIRIAEQQMKVANAELGAAIANQYPRFYLTGAPGTVATDFDELFSSGSDFWNINAGIQWNLFDGGLRKALESVAEHQTQTSALAYQRTVLQAFGEVESLLSAYGNSIKYIQLTEKALASEQAVVSRIEKLKDSGLASTPELLKARMNLHQQESALLTARTQHASLVVGLYKALGGHWTNTGSDEEGMKKI